MNRRLIIGLTLLVSPFCASAQNDFEAHAEAMYLASPGRYSVGKIEEMGFGKWQNEFRTELRAVLGIDVIESYLGDFRPEAKFIRSEDAGFALREWWTLTTEPDVTIPFIVMRPKDLKDLVPLMITPHGHSKSTEIAAGVYRDEEERASGEDGERNVAVQAVQHGFIAIAPTARGFGETRCAKDIAEGHKSSCYDLALKDALVGRTPVGDRVWDIMKLIDWALENLPVDGKNIIVSGNSGGGTASLYAAAVDTRISISVPASSFCDFSRSIGHRCHCACNYIPGVMCLADMGEIAGLTAPRAFCAVNGVKDELFPVDGAKKAFAVTEKIYGLAGAPENCSLYIGPEGHRYYKEGAWEFILSHLNTEKSTNK